MMFFKVSLGKPITLSVFGDVGVSITADEVVFNRDKKTLKVTRWGVTTNLAGLKHNETTPPVSFGNGAGLWCKDISFGDKLITIRSTYTSEKDYEVSIATEDDVVIVSTLNGKPEVLVIGCSETWCNTILSLMGYKAPKNKTQKGEK